MFNEFLLKYKKHIILVIAFLVIVGLINGISNMEGNKRRKVIKAITYNGFVLDDDGALYEKNIDNESYETYASNVSRGIKDSYRHLYFDPYSYQLIGNYFEYDDGAEETLTTTYDYRDGSLKYTYNATLEKLDITYSGKLNNKGFTCKNDYAFNAGTSNKDDFCIEIEQKVREFDKVRLETITSAKILNYMKQK